MTPDVYSRLIALLNRTGGASTLRQETFPCISGGRKHNGRFDVEVAYVLSAHGIGFEDERIVGKPTKVPHRESDEIKDAVARLGWLPGVPSPDVLRAMDAEERTRGITYRSSPVVSKTHIGQAEKEKIVASYLTGLSLHSVGMLFGYDAGVIRWVLIDQKVPRRRHVHPMRQTGEDEKKAMAASYLEGLSLSKVAALFHCGPHIVARVLCEMQIPLRPPRKMKPQA